MISRPVVVVVAILVTLFPAPAPAVAAVVASVEHVPAYAYDDPTGLVHDAQAVGTTPEPPRSPEGALSSLESTGVAAKTVDIGGAKFAQKSFSETFSKGGAFSGRTIDDVAGSLRSGAMSPKDVPIDVILRDGNTLILNTRSSQALIRGGSHGGHGT